MSRSSLSDAFEHHMWASITLLDMCLALSPEQVETAVPGTYGSIRHTARHLVGSDAWYLFTLTDHRAARIDEEQMTLTELRAEMVSHGDAWSSLLAQDPDPDAVVTEVDEGDGYRMDATIGIRLAQALHHGTDHRSQICTALTSLGMKPPNIDVWDFGMAVGRVVEVLPAT